MASRLREQIQRKDAKARRRKGLGQRHRVGARQPRTLSALGRKKTISMSKLMSPISLLPQHASRAPGLSSEFVPTRETRASPTRSALGGGEARSRKGMRGEESPLAEPRDDRTAHQNGAGGRTAPLKGTPLRLRALATLRFCLFCISLKERNPLKNSKL